MKKSNQRWYSKNPFLFRIKICYIKKHFFGITSSFSLQYLMFLNKYPHSNQQLGRIACIFWLFSYLCNIPVELSIQQWVIQFLSSSFALGPQVTSPREFKQTCQGKANRQKTIFMSHVSIQLYTFLWHRRLFVWSLELQNGYLPPS